MSKAATDIEAMDIDDDPARAASRSSYRQTSATEDDDVPPPPLFDGFHVEVEAVRIT